eukprot:1003504-Pleurochrysis_carterae.AAC.3
MRAVPNSLCAARANATAANVSPLAGPSPVLGRAQQNGGAWPLGADETSMRTLYVCRIGNIQCCTLGVHVFVHSSESGLSRTKPCSAPSLLHPAPSLHSLSTPRCFWVSGSWMQGT